MAHCYVLRHEVAAVEEEDAFFDTRDDLSSVSNSCPSSPALALCEPGCPPWTGHLGSVRERRERFIRTMGLELSHCSLPDCGDFVAEVNADNEIATEIEIGRLPGSENESLMSNWSTEQMNPSGDGISDDNSVSDFGKDVKLDKNFSSLSFILKLMRQDDKNSISIASKKIERRRIGWLRRLGVGACIVDQGGDEASTSSSDCDQCDSGSGSGNGRFERVKVHSYQKRLKELSAVYSGQVIKAHDGAILTMKFSPDGQYLASGGEDGVVRVWRVMQTEVADECEIPTDDPSCMYLKVEDKFRLAPVHTDIEKKGKGKSMKRTADSACVMIPAMVFQISEKPLHEFRGHSGHVLDLSWSKNKLLLSSSTDKTVRLWEVGCANCLKVFPHSNYVTCIQFNPIDDNYFISGSIDGKIRVWKVPGCCVVDWADVREIVTAICYRQDGKGAVVGTITGNCRFYDASDNLLQLEAQISLNGKKKSTLKRITGFQFCPGDSSKLMVTSADSKIRIIDGFEIIQNYGGLRSGSCQLSAAFTPDGRHVVSASEDSNIYIWNHMNQDESVWKQAKTTRSCEHFHSGNTSIAIPWNGSKPRSPISSASEIAASHQDLHDNALCSSAGILGLSHEFSLESNCKSSATWPEEMLPSCSIGAVALDELQYKFLRNCCQSASHAWGQVIVTAGRDGRIRSFQNYGLPVHR